MSGCKNSNRRPWPADLLPPSYVLHPRLSQNPTPTVLRPTTDIPIHAGPSCPSAPWSLHSSLAVTSWRRLRWHSWSPSWKPVIGQLLCGMLVPPSAPHFRISKRKWLSCLTICSGWRGSLPAGAVKSEWWLSHRIFHPVWNTGGRLRLEGSSFAC